MSNRIAAYINKDTMEREDVAMLMSDDSQDIKLFRFTDLGGNDGFRKQSPERKLRYIRTIPGRIDKQTRIYAPVEGTDGKVTQSINVATVYYKDLRVDDVLMVPGQSYTVKFINKVGQSFTEAEVEVVV